VTVTPLPNAGGTIEVGSTFGDTAGSTVTPVSVPAPGGLILALMGIPAVGLRRVFRRKGATA